MKSPFDLGNATIRDLPHVLVTRQAPSEGSLRCTYQKKFKSQGLPEAQYWIERENLFLLGFASRKIRQVVDLHELKRFGQGLSTPTVRLLATLDAGITIQDWLLVRPRYHDGTVFQHPFTQLPMLLLLLKACLTALKAIHILGIVHCDIKPDNICLDYSPYPYNPQSGDSLTIRFERIRLIDFAFSISQDYPLEHHLPILPKAPYQSNSLKSALTEDYAKDIKKGLSVQHLDWRVDLYSLGYMAEELLNTGLKLPQGHRGIKAYDEARKIIQQLKGFDDLSYTTKASLPHDNLISDIENIINRLSTTDLNQGFCVLINEAEENHSSLFPNADGLDANKALGKTKGVSKDTVKLPKSLQLTDLSSNNSAMIEKYLSTELTPIATPTEYLTPILFESTMVKTLKIENSKGTPLIDKGDPIISDFSVKDFINVNLSKPNISRCVKVSLYISALPLLIIFMNWYYGLFEVRMSSFVMTILTILFSNVIATYLWTLKIKQMSLPLRIARSLAAIVLFMETLILSIIIS